MFIAKTIKANVCRTVMNNAVCWFIRSRPTEEYAAVSRIGQPSQPEVAKTVAAPLAAPRTVANKAEPTSPSASEPPGSVLSITEEDRQRILEEEQKQLDEILVCFVCDACSLIIIIILSSSSSFQTSSSLFGLGLGRSW